MNVHPCDSSLTGEMKALLSLWHGLSDLSDSSHKGEMKALLSLWHGLSDLSDSSLTGEMKALLSLWQWMSALVTAVVKVKWELFYHFDNECPPLWQQSYRWNESSSITLTMNVRPCDSSHKGEMRALLSLWQWMSAPVTAVIKVKWELFDHYDNENSKAGPVLLNKLPLHIRSAKSLISFKHSLKTQLFQLEYNIV